jgi:AraC-like DNA-binding protein
MTEIPQVLSALGLDPARVIRSAGIDPVVLRNPESALSFPEVDRLVQACASATKCEHFGLLVGQRSGTTALGLVGRLMQTAPTLGDAILDLCANHERYVRGATVYLVVHDGTAFLGHALHRADMQTIEQFTDGAIAEGFNIVRELVGAAPEEVRLCRRTPADVRPYQRFFGCAVQFDAEQSALVFPATMLARPVLSADWKLRSILEDSVAQYWAVKQPSFTDRLARILCARVTFGGDSLEGVARYLSMHPRTLNRRLQVEGSSFRALLSRARSEAARQLLTVTKMDITTIAHVLGYSDSSGFSHAFRRWAGKAPVDWRAGMSNLDAEQGVGRGYAAKRAL